MRVACREDSGSRYVVRPLAKLTKSARRVEGLKADMTQHRIRLRGIDAPETLQDLGRWAKQASSELPFGKT